MFDSKNSKLSITYKNVDKEYYEKAYANLKAYLKEEEIPRIAEHFHLATLQTTTTSVNENTNQKQVLFEDEQNESYAIITRRPMSDYETFEYVIKKVVPWCEQYDPDNMPSIELICNFVKFPLIYRNKKFTVGKTYFDLDLVKPEDQNIINEVNKILES